MPPFYFYSLHLLITLAREYMLMVMVAVEKLVCPACLKRKVEYHPERLKWICPCGWHCSVKPESALYDPLEKKDNPS